MFFLVPRGSADLVMAFVDFFVPVTLGNAVGGLVFVTWVIYAMTAERRLPDPHNRRPQLGISEWLFGRHAKTRGE